MVPIGGDIKKKNTCVIAIIIFMKIKEQNKTKMYRVLSFFLYFITDDYVFIDYISCQ